MAILPIVLFNHPVLRTNAEPVREDSAALQQLIDDMFDTMYEANGVGLAAPQIGKSLRLFVVDADVMVEDTDEEPLGPLVFINPEITSFGQESTVIEEGCLSLPELREDIARPNTITLKFLDREFKSVELEFSGWISRVIQHELDHLNGVLFFDHLGSFKQRLIQRKLAMIDAGKVPTDYPVLLYSTTD
jgi:peptide deformylase